MPYALPRLLLSLVVPLALACGAGPAAAQPGAAFPQKPVRIIVPFPAGGTADSIPRIVAEKLSARWGQAVIVDNRPGAGGNIGAEQAFHADPDGYTLLASPPGPLAVNSNLYKKLNYDVSKFVPVTLLATMPNVLAVRPSLKVNSVKELIELAKQQPNKVSFASQGNGTTSHLTASMLQLQTGVALLHVPYKGTAPAMSDLIGGQVDMMFDNISSSLGQYKGGRIKLLAVASTQRAPSIPEVPTMQESGLPSFQSGTWVAVVAPPGTPVAITNAIRDAMAEAVRMPDVKQRFADLGGEAVGDTSAQLATFLSEERARWADVIKRAHVSID